MDACVVGRYGGAGNSNKIQIGLMDPAPLCFSVLMCLIPDIAPYWVYALSSHVPSFPSKTYASGAMFHGVGVGGWLLRKKIGS